MNLKNKKYKKKNRKFMNKLHKYEMMALRMIFFLIAFLSRGVARGE
jgi:hypothetical protein